LRYVTFEFRVFISNYYMYKWNISSSKSNFFGDIMGQLETLNLQKVNEKSNIVGVRPFKCNNHMVHNVKVIEYADGSIWVSCPLFGWYTENCYGKAILKLGCKERKKRCTWYIETR